MWCLVSQANSVILEVQVDPKAIGQECLEKACDCLGVSKECDYFGLKYQNAKGEELWLNLRNPIERQTGGGVAPLRFALRVKFWVPPHLLLQEATRSTQGSTYNSAVAHRPVVLLVLSTLLLIDAKPEGHAHSFANFHGPVTGHVHEVTWDDDDGHYHEDYVAHPHYAFSYGVKDPHTGDYHGQKEHRDGTDVFGEYTVKEPDGNIRTVKYRAGKDGFHAKVHNSHRNDRQQDVYHHNDHY